MAGIASRLTEAFRIKAEQLLDAAEDPREVLDFAHARQLELLRQVRQSVVVVATARERTEQESGRLRASERALEEQAQQALDQGREDLARQALAQRAAVRNRIAALEEQQPLLAAEEQRLTADLHRLEARVDAFGARKETLKAEYTAARARARIEEAVAGVGEEIGDIGEAVRRAQDRTELARARSAALERLTASGALEDATAGPDDVRIELDRITAAQGVEDELRRLKQKRAAVAPARPQAQPRTRRAESGGESSA